MDHTYAPKNLLRNLEVKKLSVEGTIQNNNQEALNWTKQEPKQANFFLVSSLLMYVVFNKV